MKILIADDDPQILRALKVTLGAHGYEIHTASDGREALDVAMTQHPDLVMLDLAMPTMDGLQALPLIREVAKTRVIVLSGFDQGMMAGKAAEAGADGYLEKGVPMEELARTIDDVLDVEPV